MPIATMTSACVRLPRITSRLPSAPTACRSIPVARFHLGNGAEVHRVHARADMSDKGLRQSGGVMVNYLYDLGRVAQNHERFAASHEVATSPEIRALAAAAEKAAEKEAEKANQ
jgi:malonyl-CoA decarboxylase